VNSTQTQHLNKILEEASHLITAKYVRGAKEHQSTLSEDYTALQILDMAIEEAVDQIVYLLTLREKLK
jgi:hypothetical protein